MSTININVSKLDMGLDQVDNTSDLNKPISTATQTALNLKVDKVTGSRLITSAEGTILGNTSGTNTGDQDLSGYQLTSGKDASSGYVGISAGNVITLPLGRGFISNNVTPNQIAYFDNSGNLLTLSVATYPSITELSYVKGLTGPVGTLATQSGTFSGTSSGTNTGDQTFLNARVQTVTSSATVTPVSTNDLVIITAQATGLTLANPTGTFTEGQALMIRIKDNATAQTITFDTNYRAIGVTLPTTTVISKTLYLGIIYNSTDGKWDVIGYNIQA